MDQYKAFNPKKQTKCYDFMSISYLYSFFYQHDLNRLKYIMDPCYIYYTDITSHHINVALYRRTLEDSGLLPIVPQDIISPSWVGKEFRRLMYRLLFNPEYSLCTLINHHLEKLHQRTMIGIQLRFGGNLANFQERQIQGEYAMNVALNEVSKYMRKHNLNRENTYLYVSTDSNKILKRIHSIVKKTGIDFLYTVNDFTIGHSATAKSMRDGLKTWERHYNRAILDMFILKDCDYLIYSQGSSFGGISSQLQKTFNNAVSSDNFLKEKGLNCSVYTHRTKGGDSFVILLSRGNSEKKLRFNV